ncbi:MAG TPA: hypothetical protein VNX86_14880 [Rhizomicrobium sp.]|nr:hypothetical protein [Rhizomicrobium sp.]
MCEDGDVLARHVTLKAGDLRRLKEDAIDRKFLAQLALPLIAKMRRREDPESLRSAAVEELAYDHTSLDRLADANVVRNQ